MTNDDGFADSGSEYIPSEEGNSSNSDVNETRIFNSSCLVRPQMVLLALIAAPASSAQQYSGGSSNYVESDYDYDSGAQPAPPPRPTQRPYSRPAPASSIRASGPPTPRVTPVPILKQINRLD
ncbi:hypothetical protein C0J52_06041 [Blattella germanica]|nr:hypothetical protein C0J52_06041 [Blattella germanica]